MSTPATEDTQQEEGCTPSKCATCPLREGCGSAGGKTAPDPGI